MKSPIFLDQGFSYHPFEKVVEILKKKIEPFSDHSLFQKEIFITKREDLKKKLFSLLGLDDSAFCYLEGSYQLLMQTLCLHHYTEEAFVTGKQHVLCAPSSRICLEKFFNKLTSFGIMVERVTKNAQGQITLEEIKSSITPRTSFVSLSWSDLDTGVISPIYEIGKFCQEKGILTHLDISDVVGKLYFDLKDLPFDYITFETKAFHGPIGLGALIVQNRGKSLELEEELSLSQLEAAIEALFLSKEGVDHMHLEIARLKGLFAKKLQEACPYVSILHQDVESLPHVIRVEFPYVSSEYLLYLLGVHHQLYALISGPNTITFSFSLAHNESIIEESVLRVKEAYEASLKLSHALVEEDLV